MSTDPTLAPHEAYDLDNTLQTTDAVPHNIQASPHEAMHATTTFEEEVHEDALFAIVEDLPGPRVAVALAFRGYCSELFVTGKCPRRDTTCTYDHSAAGQERCIQSFSCLSKRDLNAHQKLPPYSMLKTKTPITTWPRNSDAFPQNTYKHNTATTPTMRPSGHNHHLRDHSK